MGLLVKGTINMFKKKENGFSLVELSVAAAVAVGLAVVAVSVVSGTAASVSAKGSSAASVESCTISESLAKAGGDVEAINCAGTSAAASTSPSPSPQPAFVTTGYTAVDSISGIGGSTLNNYLAVSGNSGITNYDSNIATTWTQNTPVLIVNEAGFKYGFISLNAAKYGIDYYDNAGNNNPTVIDNVYYVAVGGVPNLTVGQRSIIIHYSSDPTVGPATKLTIAWQGFATDAPSGK
jgi:type II secretory pathway pseudopilin PulG